MPSGLAIRPLSTSDQGQLIHSSPCSRYQIWRAALPTFPAEAVVNATNRQMILNTSIAPGGEFQIVRAAGNDLVDYLHHNFGNRASLPTGEVVATPSFAMRNCWFLIHVNGPNYRTRTRKTLPLLRQQLADCYRRCLEEAEKHGIRSIAFPCISTGATLGWPRAIAARIGIDTIRRWFNHPIFGQRRRERIPGPIYFLADPIGPFSHQEEAWLVAFNEFFPASEAPPPPRPRVPMQSFRKERRQATAVRGRGRQTSRVPALKRENASVVNPEKIEDAGPSNPVRKRKRTISDREMRNLRGDEKEPEQLLSSSKKRTRKTPRRFGQEE